MSWNYSEAVDRISQGEMQSRIAIYHDGEAISYQQLGIRARGIGSWLQQQGVRRHAHVGHYMRNSNAYLEAFLGSSLIGAAHVNVNYRYRARELEDLCNSLDIEVLVYDGEFASLVAQIKHVLRSARVFVEVCKGTPANDFAVALSSLYEVPADTLVKDTAGENQLLIATGGTTGKPKGTQWQHTGAWHKMGVWAQGVMAGAGLTEPPANLDEYISILERLDPGRPVFPVCPLMHGTGLLASLTALAQANSVVTMSSASFDANECLDLIKAHKVGTLIIVGDVFALPLLKALELRSDHSMASLQVIISSGAILSRESRTQLVAACEGAIIYDTLGSSEAIGIGVASDEAGVFIPLPTTKIFDEALNEIHPGDEAIGIAYSGGPLPMGYYNEPEKSAETFVVINGENYVKTGNFCKYRADGKLELLGRDNTVINTGGEKVYTAEVERELMNQSVVGDAVVVGQPDKKLGSMVVAVIEAASAAHENLSPAELKPRLQARLASYKIPKHYLLIESMPRHANGKPDYPCIKDHVESVLGGNR